MGIGRNEQRKTTQVVSQILRFSRFRWAKHVVRMGDERTSFRVFIKRPPGKSPWGRLSQV